MKKIKKKYKLKKNVILIVVFVLLLILELIYLKLYEKRICNIEGVTYCERVNK